MSTQDRAPAFPFYAKDWLADPKCRALSWASKGRYIDLLASMWEHGRAGCQIPRKTAEGLYGKAFVAEIADGPSAVLIAYADDEGVMWVFSDRLSQEAQRVASRSAAAKASAEARWKNR